MNIIQMECGFNLQKINSKKYIIFYNNKENSRFPIYGWFRECYYCKRVTTKEFYFTTIDNIVYNINLCRCCGIYNKDLYKDEKNSTYKQLLENIFFNNII